MSPAASTIAGVSRNTEQPLRVQRFYEDAREKYHVYGHRFKCRSCGFEAHADVNAAVNIRQAALLVLAKQMLVPATAAKAAAMFRQAGVGSEEQALLVAAAEKLSKKKTRSKAPRTTRSCPSVVSAGELCAEAGVGIS